MQYPYIYIVLLSTSTLTLTKRYLCQLTFSSWLIPISLSGPVRVHVSTNGLGIRWQEGRVSHGMHIRHHCHFHRVVKVARVVGLGERG